MPDKIILFGDSTLSHHVLNAGDKPGAAAIFPSSSRDLLECIGPLSHYSRQHVLDKEEREDGCRYHIERLGSLANELLVSMDSVTKYSAKGLETFDTLGPFAQIMSNPHLVRILCTLLRTADWKVEFATTAYFTDAVVENPMRLISFLRFFNVALEPLPAPGSVVELTEDEDGVIIGKRDYLNTNRAWEIFEAIKSIKEKNGGAASLAALITEVLRVYCQTADIAPEPLDAQSISPYCDPANITRMRDISMIYVCKTSGEAKAFSDWRKTLGAKPEDSVVITLDERGVFADPYVHFNKVLMAAFSSQPLSHLYQLVFDPASEALKDFSAQHKEEFRQKVMGTRFFGAPALGVSRDFARSVTREPLPELNKNVAYSIATAPDSSSFAVGYADNVVLTKLMSENVTPMVIALPKGKVYALAYDSTGSILLTGGKQIHYIDLRAARPVPQPFRLKIPDSFRILDFTIDHMNGLSLLLHERPHGVQRTNKVHRLYLPTVQLALQEETSFGKWIKDGTTFKLNPPKVDKNAYAKRFSIAAFPSQFGNKTQSVATLSVAPDAVPSVRTAGSDRFNHIFCLQVRNFISGEQRNIAAESPGGAFKFECVEPYGIKVTHYTLVTCEGPEEGFVVALVESGTHNVLVYKFWRKVEKRLVGHINEDTGRPIDLSVSAGWKRKHLFTFTKLDSQVRGLQFTPGGRNLICHTMVSGSALIGKIHALRIPTIGSRVEVLPDAHYITVDTRCGIPVEVATMLTEDRATPMAIIVDESNRVSSYKLPAKLFEFAQ